MELTKDSPVEDFINILNEIGKEKRQKIFLTFTELVVQHLQYGKKRGVMNILQTHRNKYDDK